ncbi:hypothetical protein GQ457_07G010100 [Hibiscus cannabinus]
MVHQPFIRKAINNIFYRFIFEMEKHGGVVELLEILGSIINGFALSLKEGHKLRFLFTSPNVFQCIINNFLIALLSLLSKTSSKLTSSSDYKKLMFLGDLEEVLEATQLAEFQRCMVTLFHQIDRCLNTSHFQALMLFLI